MTSVLSLRSGYLLAHITLEIGASGSRILDVIEGISLVRDSGLWNVKGESDAIRNRSCFQERRD